MLPVNRQLESGVLVARWATHLLVVFMSSGRSPISLDLNPNVRILAFTAAVLRVVLFPTMLSSAYRSMSKTWGRTAAPPETGTALMFTLIPPVDGYAATPCN